MREFYVLIFSATIIAILGVAQIALLFLLNRPWWRRRWIRNASWMLPLFGIVMVILWGVGMVNSQDWLTLSATVLTALTMILELALMLALPISGIVHLFEWAWGKARQKHQSDADSTVDVRRRHFLKGMAAAMPIATVSLGATGFSRSLMDANIPMIQLHFGNLPEEFDGLRILHLSDIHLGRFVQLGHIEQILTDAAEYDPDMILVTGDIADDLTVLDDTLRLLENARVPLGAYACLGNHEHYRGVRTVYRIFDSSTVPLLVDNAITVEHEGARLRLAGVDDPRFMGASTESFYEQAIPAALATAPEELFTLLMCHRPDGFHAARRFGVDLTLAGHTHGGQIGLFGRSVFDSFYPERYLWGHYVLGASQLYTTAGAGHWFPFRLGCPTEAPIIILQKA